MYNSIADNQTAVGPHWARQLSASQHSSQYLLNITKKLIQVWNNLSK